MTIALLLSLSLLAAGAPADLSEFEVGELRPGQEAAAEPVPLDPAERTPAPLFLGLGDFQEQATCTAQCDPHADQMCSGTSCSAVNRNCSIGQRGYAVCDGIYHYCPVCPTGECEEDDVRTVSTGTCCPPPDGGLLKEVQQCQDGEWVTGGYFCSPNIQQCPPS